MAQDLKQALATYKQHPKNGQTGLQVTSDSAKGILMKRLNDLQTIGGQCQGGMELSVIGSQRGAIGAERMSKKVAYLAEKSVGELLPYSAMSWIVSMEEAKEQAVSVGMRAPAMPSLTSSEIEKIETELAVLNEILKPVNEKRQGAELAALLTGMFAVFPFGLRHDENHAKLKVGVWCDELEHLPLYAIRIAVKWAKRGNGEPDIGPFIQDVQSAIGHKVLQRKALLRKLIMESKSYE